MGAPLSLGAAARHFLATALVVLLPLVAAAQGTSATEQERDHAAAHAEYEVGHYAAAFTAFASLADGGHAESARVAMQMHRYGPSLYQMRFAAGPKQIGRWTALVSCRHQAAAEMGACTPTAGAAAASRR